MIRLPPQPTLFPYTTLFRSSRYEHQPSQRGRLPLNSHRQSQTVLQQVWMEPGDYFCRQRRSEYVQFTTNQDRKSTRLNSSHVEISYAVFCLKKKKKKHTCKS